MKKLTLFSISLCMAAGAQVQNLPTGVKIEPFYDVDKPGLSFAVDKQSVSGIYEVPGKPQHFVVLGYFGFLWTLYPDTTKTYAPGAIKDYTKKQVANFNEMVMKGHEQGAQGGAFDPWFRENRYFYVIYNKYANPSAYHTGVTPRSSSDGFQNAGLVAVDRYKMSADFNSMTRDTTLFVAEHGKGYGASNMVFGSDGMLYISPNGYNKNGWDSTEYMRKVLRIDVRRPEGGRMYTIPRDNPFYNSTFPGIKKEIFALGFRNTYNLHADYLTGKIWGAEVGEGDWEEVNIIEAGKNYGWANGGDYAPVGYMSIGLEGPCSPDGGGYTSASADTANTNSPRFVTPFTRTYRGQTFTCKDLTNAAWSFNHDGRDFNGAKTALPGTTIRCIVVSPAFRGDPTSPFYGYHFVSDVAQKYFIAVKEGVTGAKNVGRVTGMSFIGDATHNGITSFGEDSYGNLYVTMLSSTSSGATQWHDIYRVSHPDLKPLAKPRYQVHPIDPTTSLQSVRGQAGVPYSLLAGIKGLPWLRLPLGYSGAELYDLDGRRIWQGRGAAGATLTVPSNLASGTTWVRYLP